MPDSSDTSEARHRPTWSCCLHRLGHAIRNLDCFVGSATTLCGDVNTHIGSMSDDDSYKVLYLQSRDVLAPIHDPEVNSF